MTPQVLASLPGRRRRGFFSRALALSRAFRAFDVAAVRLHRAEPCGFRVPSPQQAAAGEAVRA